MATKPSFEPRSFVDGDPEQFGWKATLEWREPTTLQDAIWKVRAQEQHLLVRQLRLAYGRLAHQHLAERIDIGGSSNTWRRKFTGAEPATEDDLILWSWLGHRGERRRHREELDDWRARKGFTASGERRKHPLPRPAMPLLRRYFPALGRRTHRRSSGARRARQ